MQLLPDKSNYNGQTLINLLVAIALFAILAHSLFTLISASYSIVTYTRARVTARNIAQQKVEQIRNMPYEEIGTAGGIPAGTLEQNEYINVNGLRYLINTSVIYYDDPFDGVAPVDMLPTDYKKIRINVSWEGLSGSSYNPVTMVTDVSPKGIETTAGGGTLSIIVFDANALPVPQARVTIIASTTPSVNLTLETSDDGRVMLPGAPVCTNSCYQIIITKEGFSTDKTYSTLEVANPDKPNLNVLTGSITEVGFAIDRLGSIDVYSLNNETLGFSPLPNTNFYIRGEKTIGTNTQDELVYKYTNTFTTNSSGNLNIENLEWDNYQISVDSVDGWDISSTKPLIPLNLLPGEALEFQFTLSTHTLNSALLAFIDPGGIPIASVSAVISDNLGFSASASSGLGPNPNFGQTFFSNLTAKIYNLTATASGLLNFDGTIDIIGNKIEKVIMNYE